MPVFVAENVGVMPMLGLFPPSRRVIEIVDVATPSATTGPVPVMLEFAATGAEATKIVVVVTPPNPAGVAMERVFVSATVERIDPVATPAAFVTAAG